MSDSWNIYKSNDQPTSIDHPNQDGKNEQTQIDSQKQNGILILPKRELYKIPIEDFEFNKTLQSKIHNDLTYDEYGIVELILKKACKSS